MSDTVTPHPATETHEAQVRRYYDVGPGCVGAADAYDQLLNGPTWHHGDPTVEQATGSIPAAQEAMQRRIIDLARLRDTSQWALDFGSGPGGATIGMAQASGAHFVGVSNSATLTNRARTLATRLGVAERVAFLNIGDRDYATGLTAWPTGSFDAVTALESPCHLPDKAALFRSAFRLLRPGGRIVVLDWMERPFGQHQTQDQIRAITSQVCQHIRLAGLVTLQAYADMMREAGFEVTDAEDLWAGVPCWGSTPDEDRPAWLHHGDSADDPFRLGKLWLDKARQEGVFTVGILAGTRP